MADTQAVQKRSPFEAQFAGDRPNPAGKIGVRLSAGVLSGVLQIATWTTGAGGLDQALSAVLEAVVPAQTGDVVQLAGGGLLLRTGPEELLLIGASDRYGLAMMRQAIQPNVGSVTDLGHARCGITIQGERSRDTLAKLFALDLREAQFPLGQARLTGHHHVPCLLHRVGLERFDLYVFTTYAADQLSTLIDAALEYGVGLHFK